MRCRSSARSCFRCAPLAARSQHCAWRGTCACCRQAACHYCLRCRHSSHSCLANRRCRARRGACVCCRQAACRWLVHCRHNARFCCHHSQLAARRRWRTRCRRSVHSHARPAWIDRPLMAPLGKRGARHPRRNHLPSRLSLTAAARGTVSHPRREDLSQPSPPLRRQDRHRRRRRPHSHLHRLFAGLGLGLRFGRRGEDGCNS